MKNKRAEDQAKILPAEGKTAVRLDSLPDIPQAPPG
jgi:hypothetical protein